jgi:Tfp pilus assembly protein PilF
MNSGQGTNASQKNFRSRLYLVIGLIMLVIMALVSAADGSLVYMTLGVAVYFLFLSYWQRPQNITPGLPRANSSDDDVAELLKTIFKSKNDPGQSAVHSSSGGKTRADSKVIIIASTFIFVVFFIIAISVMMFPDEMGEEAVSLFQKAEQFRYNSEYDSAKIYYRKAIQEDPDQAEAALEYGNIFLSEKAYDSALWWFDKAIAANPQYDDARYNKALVRYYQERYDLSRTELRTMLQINPEYYDATLLLGDTYYAQNEYDSAISWYEKGYAHGERNAALCHVMAYIYDVKNKTTQAIPLYQEALSYDSARIDIYSRLAELIPDQAKRYNELAKRFSQ